MEFVSRWSLLWFDLNFMWFGSLVHGGSLDNFGLEVWFEDDQISSRLGVWLDGLWNDEKQIWKVWSWDRAPKCHVATLDVQGSKLKLGCHILGAGETSPWRWDVHNMKNLIPSWFWPHFLSFTLSITPNWLLYILQVL